MILGLPTETFLGVVGVPLLISLALFIWAIKR